MEFCLEVSGEYGCFTNPALKAERFSYPIITPSAIRGIFEAIYWKPQMRWQPTKIQLLSEIKYYSFRTNELKAKAHKNKIFIENNRTQRYTNLLLNPKYRVSAKIVDADNYKKHSEIFKRRANKGQSFHAPYFDYHEFDIDFELVDNSSMSQDLNIIDMDFNLMLYDIFYSTVEVCKGKKKKTITKYSPSFYHAKMQSGIINIPDRNSGDVLK